MKFIYKIKNEFESPLRFIESKTYDSIINKLEENSEKSCDFWFNGVNVQFYMSCEFNQIKISIENHLPLYINPSQILMDSAIAVKKIVNYLSPSKEEAYSLRKYIETALATLKRHKLAYDRINSAMNKFVSELNSQFVVRINLKKNILRIYYNSNYSLYYQTLKLSNKITSTFDCHFDYLLELFRLIRLKKIKVKETHSRAFDVSIDSIDETKEIYIDHYFWQIYPASFRKMKKILEFINTEIFKDKVYKSWEK